jgi:hypothetical protein
LCFSHILTQSALSNINHHCADQAPILLANHPGPEANRIGNQAGVPTNHQHRSDDRLISSTLSRSSRPRRTLIGMRSGRRVPSHHACGHNNHIEIGRHDMRCAIACRLGVMPLYGPGLPAPRNIPGSTNLLQHRLNPALTCRRFAGGHQDLYPHRRVGPVVSIDATQTEIVSRWSAREPQALSISAISCREIFVRAIRPAVSAQS